MIGSIRSAFAGIGPAVAIPMALSMAGLTVKDIDVFEINEAFASQALYCAKKLAIDADKLNPNGGAIALGHPLGTRVCTAMHADSHDLSLFQAVLVLARLRRFYTSCSAGAPSSVWYPCALGLVWVRPRCSRHANDEATPPLPSDK